MSPQQLARIAAALVAALLLWGLLAIVRSGSSDEVERAQLLGPFVEEQIDGFAFISAEDSISLRRGASGRWVVNGLDADSARVSDFFKGVAEAVEGEVVASSTSSHERMGVDMAGGTRLVVYQGGQVVAELIVGNRGRAYRTAYARRVDGDTVYTVEGEFTSVFERSLKDWRNRIVMSVSGSEIASITIDRGGDAHYRVTRADSGWVLDDGSPADSAKTAGYVRKFRPLMTQGAMFATAEESDSLDFANPDRRLVLQGESGDTLVALLFDEADNGYWVRHASGGTVFQLMSWKANEITPIREAFEPDPPEGEGTESRD